MVLSAVCQVKVFPDPLLLPMNAAAGVTVFVYVIAPQIPVAVKSGTVKVTSGSLTV
jgi:hypothetical protein